MNRGITQDSQRPNTQKTFFTRPREGTSHKVKINRSYQTKDKRPKVIFNKNLMLKKVGELKRLSLGCFFAADTHMSFSVMMLVSSKSYNSG